MKKPGSKTAGAVLIWRRPGKGMFIGRSVRVTVLECTPSTVRLGVEAPLSTVVSDAGIDREQHLVRQLDRDVRAAVPATGEDVEPYILADMARDLTILMLLRDQSVKIGREATVTYVGQEDGRRASLSVEASLNIAITRDDFTFEEHLREQSRRERGERPFEPD